MLFFVYCSREKVAILVFFIGLRSAAVLISSLSDLPAWQLDSLD